MLKLAGLIAAAVLFALSAARAAEPLRATAEALRDRALADSTAYDMLEGLTTEVGQRQVGTAGQKRFVDWGLERLHRLGFQNVHAEPFLAQAWLRGPESAEVLSPFPQKLQILGLGRSVPTPPGGIEAEIVVFPTYASMLDEPPDSLTGKIAVVTEPMRRTRDGAGYSALLPALIDGASEAARRGAAAYLVRSLSTAHTRLPHAGALRYADGVARIPAAALSVPDAELLARMVSRGPVRIRLSLASSSLNAATAWNLVGEVVGREHPDQVLVVGGHMDSWDPGQGAGDGAGMAIATAAAKLINDLPRRPKRTIRLVLFGAEELDDSGAAYADAHGAEAGRMVLAAESDAGADDIVAIRLPAGGAQQPGLKDLAAVLAPLRIEVSSTPARESGTDTADLVKAGVPPVGFDNDVSRYFDWRHSADDTLDKIDRAQLNQNVAAWASFLYLAAEGDVDFRAGAAPK